MIYFGTGIVKNKTSIGKINQYSTTPKSHLILLNITKYNIVIDIDISGYLEYPPSTVKGNYFA